MSKKKKFPWKKEFTKHCNKPFSKQAQWWLNGCWDEKDDPASEYAEAVWDYVHMFIEVGTGQKVLYGKKKQKLEEGCDLAEDKAHLILEKLGETMTVLEMRKKFKALDIDNNHKLSLIEFLISKHEHTPVQVNEFKQGGGDPRILQRAVAKFEAAQTAMDTALESKETAETAHNEAEAKAKQAATDEAAAHAAEAEVKTAEAELQAAVDEMEKLEAARAKKIKKLESKSTDQTLGNVKRNSAFAKLEQLKAEDPLPLRKAKITQKSALKKVKKERKKAVKARKAAVGTKAAADEAEAAAVVAKEEAHTAAEAAQKAFAEVEEELNEIKEKGTEPAYGSLWWMDRVLIEKKKFLPRK